VGRTSGGAEPAQVTRCLFADPHASGPVSNALTSNFVDPTAFIVTFALILPAELPDKTFIATLVLSTRYRPVVVWLGVGTAFAVQSAIAVAAGQVLSLLPRTPVLVVTALLFGIGSFLMFHGAGQADPTTEIAQEERQLRPAPANGRRRAFLVSFTVLFAAEWGDLSQLTTASLSARFDEPLAVFLGAWCALLVVAGIAVLAGRWLARRVSFVVIRRISGSLLALLSVVTALEAAGISLL
jgi:putative Ca2+/H+ antiporter (TMEM165/GDT1 family)